MPRDSQASTPGATLRPGRLLGVDLDDLTWMVTTRRRVPPGETPGEAITVSTKHANQLLRSIVRFVADIPADAPPGVVWQQGTDELWVDTSSIAIACSSGLVRIALTVDCDQVDEPTKVTVPIAVGTPKVPSGLVMSTFNRVEGPRVIADVWSDAIAAFAWEALVELAGKIAASVGKDSTGRPLIPADISATRNQLLVTPMARHDVSVKSLP